MTLAADSTRTDAPTADRDTTEPAGIRLLLVVVRLDDRGITALRPLADLLAAGGHTVDVAHGADADLARRAGLADRVLVLDPGRRWTRSSRTTGPAERATAVTAALAAPGRSGDRLDLLRRLVPHRERTVWAGRAQDLQDWLDAVVPVG